MRLRHAIAAAMVLTCSVGASAAVSGSHSVEVVVNGYTVPEYPHRGTTYIEALAGEEFTIRMTNPTPYRVAVALAVDGLNTIDARHTDARSAAKWILDPWETTEISGWQVNSRTARRFYFTTEEQSYGAALGRIRNLGVIQAVFFRERHVHHSAGIERPQPELQAGSAEGNATAPSASAAPPPASRQEASRDAAAEEGYAATGMGRGSRHHVERVDIDLERHPIASITIRYEFRPALVKLGVLSGRHPSPLQRRERARGFEPYCPEP